MTGTAKKLPVSLDWEHSVLVSNTVLGNLKFITEFLGLKENVRIQESKHVPTVPSEMESKIPTEDLPFTQRASKGKEST